MGADMHSVVTEIAQKRSIGIRSVGLYLFLGGLASVPFLPLPDYWILQLNYIGMYCLPTLGLILLTGVGRLTSFGQAAFVGIGAYVAAYLDINYQIPASVTLLVGLIVTFVSAFLIGVITLRMSGHYLPLATLAWALSLFYLMGNLEALGKYDGLLGVRGLTLAGHELGQLRGFYVIVWMLVIAACFAIIRLLDSRSGRAIRALAHGTQMAESIGVNTFRYKVGIFIFAAMLASISGWLFAYFQRTVNPSPFGLKMGIEYLFMAVIGGVSYVWGAVLGAGLIKLLEDQLQMLLPAIIGTSGNYEIVVFGILLILILKYQPDGIWEYVEARLPRKPPRSLSRVAESLSHRANLEAGEDVVVVNNIRKEFGGLVAVNDVSFKIKSGQIVGLIGPNGAGKSTTFDLITGVLPLTRGTVRLGKHVISGKSSREIAKLGVARTFQHVKLVPEMTVLENAALGAHLRGRQNGLFAILGLDKKEEASLYQEAALQLDRVGLSEYIHEPAGNLAMGQQRLLEIARALCADPILLLLDEPAAGLRHREKVNLSRVLKSLREQGITILLVEHDMSLVMSTCDHIVVMEFGTYLMAGAPEEVRASEAVRSAYLGKEH